MRLLKDRVPEVARTLVISTLAVAVGGTAYYHGLTEFGNAHRERKDVLREVDSIYPEYNNEEINRLKETVNKAISEGADVYRSGNHEAARGIVFSAEANAARVILAAEEGERAIFEKEIIEDTEIGKSSNPLLVSGGFLVFTGGLLAGTMRSLVWFIDRRKEKQQLVNTTSKAS